MKVFFIILFLTLPSLSISYGMTLSYVHLTFYLIALLLCFCNNENITTVINQLNDIKTLKFGNFLLLEKQVKELKEISKTVETNSDENNFNISLSDKYKHELSFSKLNFNYNLINAHIRQIYNLVFNDDISYIDNILVFDYLKQKEILSNDFCFYIYNVCSIISDYLKNPQNNKITSDLIEISSDIINNLIEIENYIKHINLLNAKSQNENIQI